MHQLSRNHFRDAKQTVARVLATSACTTPAAVTVTSFGTVRVCDKGQGVDVSVSMCVSFGICMPSVYVGMCVHQRSFCRSNAAVHIYLTHA